MYLAVKFYQDVVDKPTNIPELWPAEVKELASPEDLPAGPWALMSVNEYKDYRKYHQPSYDAWLHSQQ